MPETTGSRFDIIKSIFRLGGGAKAQSCDGTFTLGNLPKYKSDGTLTDSGVAAGGSTARQAVIAYFLSGKPGAGATAYVDIPSNLTTFQIPANFTGSKGKCGTNPTSTATYTFYKNGSSIGTLSIATSGVFTWATTGGTSVSFTPGADELSWGAPASQDSTLSDVRFGLAIAIS